MNTDSVPTEIQQLLTDGKIEQALDATLSHFSCVTGTVHVLREGVLRLAYNRGLPPEIAAIVDVVPIGKGMAGLAAERMEPVSICNLQSDTSGKALPGARKTGVEGSLAVPILSADGKLKGVLGIARMEAHDWTEAEKAAVLAVAAAFAPLSV